MKDRIRERLREASWRRKLTSAEESELRAWIAEHPGAPGDWELEQELTRALGGLADAPVPSNFTARVVQQATRPEPAASGAGTGWLWRWHGRLHWLPRAALVTVVAAAGVLSYQHAQNSRRRERADSVREIVSATAFPGPEVLEDYDAIQAMSQSPAADVELLKVLQ